MLPTFSVLYLILIIVYTLPAPTKTQWFNESQA